MLAVLAVRTDPADPLAGLAVAEREEPRPPEGWELVKVVAASLNHHDLFTLQGIGVDPGRLPIVLGCDASGVTQHGREVIIHAVISSAPGGDETLAPDFSILSERYDGTLAEWVAVPRRNLVEKPPELSFEEAACLPTAWLTTYRALFTQAGIRPGDQGGGGRPGAPGRPEADLLPPAPGDRLDDGDPRGARRHGPDVDADRHPARHRQRPAARRGRRRLPAYGFRAALRKGCDLT